MKKLILATLFVICALIPTNAENNNNFGFKFYGRIRADIFYNSRANNETVDGLFFIYPKDYNYDANGKDLNATPQGSMYMLYTRMGVDISGPKIGSAKTTAKIEVDFRGSASSLALLRLRQAYVNLDWGKSSVLIGQTWHPLFGEVFPSIINLSTGAPFNLLNRSPMLRYRFINNGLSLTAAAIWQLQYTSMGPEGKSHNYLKNSNIPELYAGVDYKSNGLIVGGGVEMLSLKPRLTSVVDGNTYKVNERVTSISVEAHAKYKTKDWFVSGKTLLANNLTQGVSLGGFGVTEIDAKTGEARYTPFRHWNSWLNFVYGQKWQPGIFVGYIKNLGTGKAITGKTYGVGLDVDQLLSTCWQISYNLPHWKIGAEFEPSTAWYGTLNNKDGRVRDTHTVTNYRIAATAIYIF